MEFSKYEATGNDFIMLDGTGGAPRLSIPLIRGLCDRHRGVGADGLIVLLHSRKSDLRMRIFNADGSEAEMCGNGIRALHLFAIDRRVAPAGTLEVETLAGTRRVLYAGERDGLKMFTVDMGEPSFRRPEVPMVGEDVDAVGVPIELGAGEVLEATCVSMGNPHCVIFVEDVENYPVSEVGPAVEEHPLFPAKVNVEFARVAGRRLIEARVWERGVGETLACGTGACATAAAAMLNGLVESGVTVSLPGGDLFVEWDRSVRMTGPARHVFDGRVVHCDDSFQEA